MVRIHAALGTAITAGSLSIRLHPDFSIHDRKDSADLMNLSWHELELELSKT